MELAEVPNDVRNGTQVLVTFIEPRLIDLQARGIDEAQAAELRACLAIFIKDWDSPEMAVYDDYDAARPVYKRGGVILVFFSHADWRIAKLCLDLIVQANDLRTGLPQVAVAMITSRLFRANHPSWVVEVVTGEARVMFADSSAPTSVKVTFPFSGFGPMEESIRQRVSSGTTIPSFYYEVRTEPEMIARRNWTRAWWDSRRQRYQLVTSVAVVDELQAGTFPNQDQALALLIGISLVPVEPAIIEIVETYIQRMVMPCDPTGDALYLALASYHKCDFLLTWNVQHLANANKFAHIRRGQYAVGVVHPSARDATRAPRLGERRCKTTRRLPECMRCAIASPSNSTMIRRN